MKNNGRLGPSIYDFKVSIPLHDWWFLGEVALEAQALRQRMMEDRLAAEAQAAENHEALVGTLTLIVDDLVLAMLWMTASKTFQVCKAPRNKHSQYLEWHYMYYW